MKESSKQILRDYFKAIEIDNMPFETSEFPYTRLTYVKAFVGFIDNLEKYEILDKIKAFYPFTDIPISTIGINVLDANGRILIPREEIITDINLSESDKKELIDFVRESSNSLTSEDN